MIVNVSPEVYGLFLLVLHLASCLYADTALDSSILFVRKLMTSLLDSDTMRPNAEHTIAITPILFPSFWGGSETIPISSA